MIQGVSGSFDIAGTNPSTFAARVFYSEQYDEITGKHILGITGISIQSKEFGYEWYPHGSVSIENEVVGTMDNSYPASHKVSLTAGSGWHTVTRTSEGGINGFKDFPWNSSEIESDEFGNRQVTISVNFLLYRANANARPSFKGSYTLELTPTARHYGLSISKGIGTDAVVTKNGKELEDGATITHGDELTISFSADKMYKITEHTVNGNPHLSGEKHTVTGDVSVFVKGRVLTYAIGSGLYHAYIGGDVGAKKYVAYIGDENDKPVIYGQ